MKEQKKSKALHIGLWVAQVVLGVAFAMAGAMKLIMPIEVLLAKGMGFVKEYSVGAVRFIGIVEILGALGLILPSALRIKPNLTPLAAIGIAIVMVLATQYHISHSEPTIPTIVMFAISVFIAWGRYKAEPISPK